MLSNGTKNILSKRDLTNIQTFWELHKLTKDQGIENKIRTQEKMKEIANEIINNKEIEETNKFYDFIKKYANGQTIKNNNMKKLFFKLGD